MSDAAPIGLLILTCAVVAGAGFWAARRFRLDRLLAVTVAFPVLCRVCRLAAIALLLLAAAAMLGWNLGASTGLLVMAALVGMMAYGIANTHDPVVVADSSIEAREQAAPMTKAA